MKLYKENERFDAAVVCKCGEEIWTIAAGKVHYLIAMTMPWTHVKKS